MNYEVIDLAAWPRREHYEHYMRAVPCTYSMTVRLDITNLRRRGLRLYPAMLWLLTGTVNRHGQFRMALRESGELVRYDSMEPCYTVFHPETEGFTNVWTEYDPVFSTFCRNYRADRERYRGDFRHGKPDAPPNLFSVSCVPWASFTGFHLDLPKGHTYLRPIFTIGKYTCREDTVRVPVAVQVHHSVCDGFHMARFLNGLQAWAESFSC